MLTAPIGSKKANPAPSLQSSKETVLMNGRLAPLITFEGGEGVGKSSLIGALAEQLRTLGVEVLCTREPGGTAVGEKIRGLFTTEEFLCKETELFLLAAARVQHVREVLKPALEKGVWVLCDRYIDSTVVYQGGLGGLDLDLVDSVNKLAIGDIEPDLTFLLDCDVDLALARLEKRGEGSRFDNAGREQHQKIRDLFLKMEKRLARMHRLDAALAPEELGRKALRLLREVFGV